jgi:GNAT superfamily N-acetyltransferase
MSDDAFRVHVLETDADIATAFPLMRVLRTDQLAAATADTFAGMIRLQQDDGYVLAAGYAAGADEPVVLAGFRVARTLSRGPHLFVDDLVTDPSRQGKGHGTAMIAWLRAEAARRDLPWVWLDSRITAKGFYTRVGFEFNTSIPCRIPASK